MSKVPSTPFSNGTEFEIFKENWCYRCRAHKKVDTKFHNFEQRDDDLDDYAFKKMMAELGKT